MCPRDSREEAQLDEAAVMRRQRRRRTRDVCRPLRHWLYGHRDAPYPSRADKLQLAAVTQLSLTQVRRPDTLRNYFARWRERSIVISLSVCLSRYNVHNVHNVHLLQ